MTKDFENMLYLFGMSAIGMHHEFEGEINVENIYKLSCEQGIWQTVYLALSQSYDLSNYKNKIIQDVARNVTKMEYMFFVISELKKNGVDCCVLKGCTVARFYREPDYRISSDTDILISRDKIGLSRKILRQLNFDVGARLGYMHHFEALHPIAGLLEVHESLYQEHIKDILFKDMLHYEEKFIKVTINGHDIYTLGINDGLNHLTAHYLKHFISKGAGIRQLLDLLLYMKHYEDKINWNKYYDLWTQLGFIKLIDILKGIGVKYWGMQFDSYEMAFVDDILDDIESGGVFGYCEADRLNFIHVFLAETNEDDTKKFKTYMNKNVVKSFFRKLFPSRRYLIECGYLYANKSRIHLFWAHLCRLTSLCIQVLKREKKISDNLQYKVKQADSATEQRRLALLKKIGILEQSNNNNK